MSKKFGYVVMGDRGKLVKKTTSAAARKAAAKDQLLLVVEEKNDLDSLDNAKLCVLYNDAVGASKKGDKDFVARFRAENREANIEKTWDALQVHKPKKGAATKAASTGTGRKGRPTPNIKIKKVAKEHTKRGSAKLVFDVIFANGRGITLEDLKAELPDIRGGYIGLCIRDGAKQGLVTVEELKS